MNTQTVNFIGIGAHKCASTWLWFNLRAHNQVWVPPQKELHYFDRLEKYPSTNEIGTEELMGRLLEQSVENGVWRKKAARNLAGSIVRFDIERLRWWLKFYPHKFNDEWYLSLFANRGGACTGEITPAYSLLDVSDIRLIDGLCPDVKIIFVIRNPIERAWSHLRFDAGLGKVKDLSDFTEVKQYIDSAGLTRRGDYVTTINNWLSVIPRDRFFVGFYDDIKNDPLLFLENMSSFLGVDVNGFPEQRASASVGVSKSGNVPVEIEMYLIDKYLEDLEKLTGMVGGHSYEWLEFARGKVGSRKDI